MAITMANAKANVKTFYYKMYIREHGTAMASTDYDTAAHWATFLALFTYAGQVENQSLKVSHTPSSEIVVDLGKKRFTTYDAKFEAKYVQGAVADLTAIRTDLIGGDVDILLVDTVNQKAIYIDDVELFVEFVETSGDLFNAMFSSEQTIPISSKIDTTVSIPQS